VGVNDCALRAGPDRFFGVIDQMFEKQKTWSRAGNDLAIVTELSKIGKLAGLGEDQINSVSAGCR
jgi:hypothetical protein